MSSTSRAIINIARNVLSELDLDTVFHRVLESAQQLTEARYAAIGVLGDSGVELTRFITAGIDESTWLRIGTPPRGRGVLGELVRNAAPLRLANISSHPRSHGFPPGHPPMSTFLGVPIPVRGKTFGSLYLAEKAGGAEFTDSDEETAVMLAELAGLAIDHARRYAGASERRDELERTVTAVEATTQIARLAAAEAERQRWARELHDETLQSLSALRVGLSTAKRSGRPEALDRAVANAIERLDEGITNLRALITDLRPASLDELGTAAAIQALAERVEHFGIDVDVSIEFSDERGRHPPELETAMYRIVQEALTNASKHGNAKRAVVEIHEDESDIRVSVRDDGTGFDPTLKTSGFGLLGMRERVQLLAGALDIDSARGRGTTVTAILPAPSPPAPSPPAPSPPAPSPPAADPAPQTVYGSVEAGDSARDPL